jgi:hypothetical protein
MIIPFYTPARHKPGKWAPKEGKLLQFPKKEQESTGDFLDRLRAIVAGGYEVKGQSC